MGARGPREAGCRGGQRQVAEVGNGTHGLACFGDACDSQECSKRAPITPPETTWSLQPEKRVYSLQLQSTTLEIKLRKRGVAVRRRVSVTNCTHGFPSSEFTHCLSHPNVLEFSARRRPKLPHSFLNCTTRVFRHYSKATEGTQREKNWQIW